MSVDDRSEAEPSLRVMSLHALVYCERLFYLEEVEEIRVADERVHAGRALHEELDEPEPVTRMDLESAALGLRGRVDAVRTREGASYPVEHKRGRPYKATDGSFAAWPSDRIQAVAYAALLNEVSERPVTEARVRYHAARRTVRVPVDDQARVELRQVIARARDLRRQRERPPVTNEERKCRRCSLVPVCLPEEARLSQSLKDDEAAVSKPVRLFPADSERRSLHILSSRSRIGRRGRALRVDDPDAERTTTVGVRELSDIVIHGMAGVSTQALRLCADEGIHVHYMTTTGRHLAVCHGSKSPVHRRIRQFRALDDGAQALALAKRLLAAKVELQLRHARRIGRRDERVDNAQALEPMRVALRGIARGESREQLLGHEGNAARAYFEVLAHGVSSRVSTVLVPQGRSRRPPRDRFNALLSFGYGLLYRDLTTACLLVGLDPAFGFLHQPRSTAYPLVLDLVELFRVPVVDMAVLGAVNRAHFDVDADFEVTPQRVWLSESGRKKLIAVYERRKHEEHRHAALDYSLSWARMMELELRLLEKEWSGEPGLFAQLRLH